MIAQSICKEDSVVIRNRIDASNFGRIKLYDWLIVGMISNDCMTQSSIVDKQIVSCRVAILTILGSWKI